MRQASYLIIGSGRLATHFLFYFNYLSLPCEQWSRKQDLAELANLLSSSTHIFLLISDNAIEPFIQKHLVGSGKIIIHCSGSLHTHLAYGAHPLMTFNKELYEETFYSKIPLIIDSNIATEKLLPGLPNPIYRIPKEEKAYYHALCVMANNFSTLLWQKFFYELQERYSIPRDKVYLFLEQTTKNIIQNPELALTGPLVRNDQKTLERDFQALAGDPFAGVFMQMIEAYNKQKQEELEHECA